MSQLNKKSLLIISIFFGTIGLTNCSSTATSTASNNANKAVVINANQTNPTAANIDNKPANIIVGNGNIKTSENSVNVSNRPTTNNETAKTKTSSGDKLGVPECDDFIAKYEICLTKIPEAQRENYRKTLETTRTGLKKAVTIPQAKAVLGISCNQSLKTARETMTEFSCEW